MEQSRIVKIILDEFVQAKGMEQYISDYIGNKMDWNKYFSMIILALSVVGAGSWGFWKVVESKWSIVPMIILLIIAVVQVFSAIQTKVVVDDSTLKSLSKLRSLYIAYSNKLERLYLNAHNQELSLKELEQSFFELRETVYPMEELKDSLNINFDIDKVRRKVERRVNMCLEDRWGLKMDSLIVSSEVMEES